jgi:hypothetical protein
LTGVEYGFNQRDQILLESKDSMRSRGLASPDDGDALALTFAHPVPIAMPDDFPKAASNQDYDPIEFMSRVAALPSEMRNQHDPYANLGR